MHMYTSLRTQIPLRKALAATAYANCCVWVFGYLCACLCVWGYFIDCL